MTGKNNPRYTKKKKLKCDNCGKSFERVPSTSNISNSDGEIHNFCCKECYWKFRSKYYIKDKVHNYNKHPNEETRNKIRKATLLQYKNGILNRQTKPQILVNNILKECNISYENERLFEYYSVDNYLTESNLIIEVMGDYFHANPTIYKKEKLDNIQSKDVIRDKRKHTYIKRYHNVEILYLWESDIKLRPELCKLLIQTYIDNDGNLNNYNSFNYSINNNTLNTNSKIINPYFIA